MESRRDSMVSLRALYLNLIASNAQKAHSLF
jgi:hypothetical protein